MGARQQPPGTVTGPSAVTWDSVLLSDAVPSPSVSDTLGRLPQHRRAMARPSLASPPWSGLAVPIPPWSGPCCPTRAFPTRFPEAGFGECVVEPVRRQPRGSWLHTRSAQRSAVLAAPPESPVLSTASADIVVVTVGGCWWRLAARGQAAGQPRNGDGVAENPEPCAGVAHAASPSSLSRRSPSLRPRADDVSGAHEHLEQRLA